MASAVLSRTSLTRVARELDETAVAVSVMGTRRKKLKEMAALAEPIPDALVGTRPEVEKVRRELLRAIQNVKVSSEKARPASEKLRALAKAVRMTQDLVGKRLGDVDIGFEAGGFLVSNVWGYTNSEARTTMSALEKAARRLTKVGLGSVVGGDAALSPEDTGRKFVVYDKADDALLFDPSRSGSGDEKAILEALAERVWWQEFGPDEFEVFRATGGLERFREAFAALLVGDRVSPDATARLKVTVGKLASRWPGLGESAPLIGGELFEGRAFKIGTKRVWNGVEVIKVAPGRWRRTGAAKPGKAAAGGSGGRGPGRGVAAGAGGGPPKDMNEAAKMAKRVAESFASDAAAALGAADAPVPTGRVWFDHVAGLPEDTSKAHKRDGKYVPERRKLHEKIIASHLAKGRKVPANRKPVALFMLGITASGKSTVRREVGIGPFDEFGAVEVDPDAVKAALPEYQQGLNLPVPPGASAQGRGASARDSAKICHKESSEVAVEIGASAVQDRRNVIFDGTGRNLAKMKKQIAAAKAAGYHVQAIMPHVSVETAKKRADERAEVTGRYVDHAVIEGMAPDVVSNFLELLSEFDGAHLFNNEGESPKEMLTSPPPKVLDKKLFDEFKKASRKSKKEAIDYALSLYYTDRGKEGAVIEEEDDKDAKRPAADVVAIPKWFEKLDAEDRKTLKGPKKYEKGEGVEMIPND